MGLELTPSMKGQVDEIIARYPVKEGAMLPVLHLLQREWGYISDEAMLMVSTLLDVPPAKVMGVVTFYPMFHTRPVGRHVIYVCATLSCSLAGAEMVVSHLKDRLGISVGETTPDGKFTLLKAECIAACGEAPAMMLDDEIYGHLTPDKIDRLLAAQD